MMLRRYAGIIVGILIVLLSVDVGWRVYNRMFSSVEETVTVESPEDLFHPSRYAMLRPGISTEISLSDGQSFPVSTNSYGMRNAAVEQQKPEGITRIAVLGNSIAFGWGLPVEQAFPQQLENILNQESEQKKFEVLNFGAPEFTTFHGLHQYQELVQNFQPDILIVAFGLYDFLPTRVPEAERYAVMERYASILNDTTVISRLARFSTVMNRINEGRKARTLEEMEKELRVMAYRGEWTVRGTPDQFQENLKRIVQSQKTQGGETILVHGNLLNFESQSALETLAQEMEVPLLDLRKLFKDLGGADERRLITQLNLKPTRYETVSGDAKSRALFRLYASEGQAVETPVYITSDSGIFHSGEAPYTRMYDDGTHGDEKRGDNVWSLEVTLDTPQQFNYGFVDAGTAQQNNPQKPVYFYHFEPAPFEGAFYWASPVFLFGQPPFAHFLQSGELPLPNELGHQAIAERLAYLVRNPHSTAPRG
ncbi:MAG: SGNH/GDSL hydrolase family protein [bacterium]